MFIQTIMWNKVVDPISEGLERVTGLLNSLRCDKITESCLAVSHGAVRHPFALEVLILTLEINLK